MAEKQLTTEEAYNVLVTGVHAPVFFEKLANAYGIRPTCREDAQELLSLAGRLRGAHEVDVVKQASATTSYLAQARRDLDAALAREGYANEPAQATVKEAANRAVANPLIREAALVFGSHMTQLADQTR